MHESRISVVRPDAIYRVPAWYSTITVAMGLQPIASRKAEPMPDPIHNAAI